MKLKCNHDRRVMVLPSGNTRHRNDGSICHSDGQIPVRAPLTIGGNKVTKMFTKHDGVSGPAGTCVLGVERDPGKVLLQEIFEGKGK